MPASEERIDALRGQVQVETALLAALHDQADQARQELAGLRQQLDDARTELTVVERQRDTRHAARALAPADGEHVVVREVSNVRANPNNAAPVLQTAPRGTLLKVHARTRDGWVQVGDEVAWGWVWSGLLDPAP
ncbi:protein of unknown function [Rhodovastum atsumiense]|nr:protein of unknown function [Rhodovastum atsumiense]